MREVTERDFRKPEFMDADPKDYEFRADGAIVRKDRWEVGMRNIASRAGFNMRDGFEIPDVVDRVGKMYQLCDTIASVLGYDADFDEIDLIQLRDRTKAMKLTLDNLLGSASASGIPYAN